MPFFDLSPDKLASYRSSTPAPADFDAFWQATLSEARQHPIDAVFTPLDIGFAAVDLFDVTFSGFGGHRIKGWYIKPAGREPTGTVVKFIGYGGGRGFPQEHLLWPGRAAAGRSATPPTRSAPTRRIRAS
jgi:cephalosporin-C deacetylase